MNKINVAIVYAEQEQQWVFETKVARGTNALELFYLAEFKKTVPALKNCVPDQLELAIYAQPIRSDHLLEEGDRVEIIRPLVADPKVVRRELAKLGKTMGNKR